MAATYVGIAVDEAKKYDAVWRRPEYRVKSHSLRLWNEHRDLFPATFSTGLDIGCGLGLLVAKWNDEGIDAWGVDLVRTCLHPDVETRYGHKVLEECLWHLEMGHVFDVGICTDVMEHIPETHVRRTLDRIADHCDRVVFKIANFPSDSLGYALHLTQRPAAWWQEQMTSVMGGTVTRCPYATNREEYVFRWSHV